MRMIFLNRPQQNPLKVHLFIQTLLFLASFFPPQLQILQSGKMTLSFNPTG